MIALSFLEPVEEAAQHVRTVADIGIAPTVTFLGFVGLMGILIFVLAALGSIPREPSAPLK